MAEELSLEKQAVELSLAKGKSAAKKVPIVAGGAGSLVGSYFVIDFLLVNYFVPGVIILCLVAALAAIATCAYGYYSMHLRQLQGAVIGSAAAQATIARHKSAAEEEAVKKAEDHALAMSNDNWDHYHSIVSEIKDGMTIKHSPSKPITNADRITLAITQLALEHSKAPKIDGEEAMMIKTYKEEYRLKPLHSLLLLVENHPESMSQGRRIALMSELSTCKSRIKPGWFSKTNPPLSSPSPFIVERR